LSAIHHHSPRGRPEYQHSTAMPASAAATIIAHIVVVMSSANHPCFAAIFIPFATPNASTPNVIANIRGHLLGGKNSRQCGH